MLSVPGTEQLANPRSNCTDTGKLPVPPFPHTDQYRYLYQRQSIKTAMSRSQKEPTLKQLY